jgi:glycosyltransferase involved in cell wall biosynthesis
VVPRALQYRETVRTAVIIPAFNEAQALPSVLSSLSNQVPDHDVVVIDDGSTDATARVARDGGATCLSLPFNLGIGGALRLGFRHVVEQGYDRAYQFDADGQHEPSQIPVLLAALDGADMVVGSRFGSHTGYRVGWGRNLAMGLLRRLVGHLSGQKFTDTSSGFRAFGRPVLQLFASEYPVEYMDSVEALILATGRGFRVVEVPVSMGDRRAGRPSNRNLRLVYHFVRVLIVLLAGSHRRPAQTS